MAPTNKTELPSSSGLSIGFLVEPPRRSLHDLCSQVALWASLSTSLSQRSKSIPPTSLSFSPSRTLSHTLTRLPVFALIFPSLSAFPHTLLYRDRERERDKLACLLVYHIRTISCCTGYRSHRSTSLTTNPFPHLLASRHVRVFPEGGQLYLLQDANVLASH